MRLDELERLDSYWRIGGEWEELTPVDTDRWPDNLTPIRRALGDCIVVVLDFRGSCYSTEQIAQLQAIFPEAIVITDKAHLDRLSNGPETTETALNSWASVGVGPIIGLEADEPSCFLEQKGDWMWVGWSVEFVLDGSVVRLRDCGMKQLKKGRVAFKRSRPGSVENLWAFEDHYIVGQCLEHQGAALAPIAVGVHAAVEMSCLRWN